MALQEMANTVLSRSESQGRDLAEQMSQRLKVTEVMLSEAVKDRERLVSENQTAVENLLATIGSKDQLLRVLKKPHTIILVHLWMTWVRVFQPHCMYFCTCRKVQNITHML